MDTKLKAGLVHGQPELELMVGECYRLFEIDRRNDVQHMDEPKYAADGFTFN